MPRVGTDRFEPRNCAQSERQPRFAEVVVPRRLHRSFTYSIPAALQSVVRVGTPVTIPFGPTTIGGIIVDLAAHPRIPPPPKGWRAILAVSHQGDGTLDPRLLSLAQWVAEYYLAPLGQCLPLILPPRALQRPRVRYVLTIERGPDPVSQPPLSELEQEIVTRLRKSRHGRSLAMLKRSLPHLTQDALLPLLNRGLVKIAAVADDPIGQDSASASGETAPRVQLAWLGEAGKPVGAALEPLLRHVQESMIRRRCMPILIEAEEQDRTQVIVASARMALEINRQCLFIAPEIRRACEIGDVLTIQWGLRVVLLHSGLSPAARANTWRRIHAGEADVVVGTRSAVFAPILNLGLIGIEDEENPSLKEEQEPRYHGREVAWHRCEQEQAVLLLISGHASLETQEKVRLQGALWSPPAEPSKASIEVVDLAQSPFGSVLSVPLVEHMRRTLAAEERVVLYVNRRGYSPSLTCGACGNAPTCVRCSVPLMFSRQDHLLTCRYCGSRTAAPDRCMICSGTEFRLIGFGTERLEEEVRRQFPSARILRRDRDETGPRSKGKPPLEAATGRLWDILIGTKLILREASARGCALLGLPFADAGLHVPDFRAAERTYHSLLDAMALVDGEAGAHVILQTFLPHHHVIRAIVERRRDLFASTEIELREALGYPPFTSLIVLQASGADEVIVHRAADQWAALLRHEVGTQNSPTSERTGRSGREAPSPIHILGPVPAPVARLRGQYRWRVLVKAAAGTEARELIRRTVEKLSPQVKKKTVKLEVDVDPVDLG